MFAVVFERNGGPEVLDYREEPEPVARTVKLYAPDGYRLAATVTAPMRRCDRTETRHPAATLAAMTGWRAAS